jgi:hypothetical protein
MVVAPSYNWLFQHADLPSDFLAILPFCQKTVLIGYLVRVRTALMHQNVTALK